MAGSAGDINCDSVTATGTLTGGNGVAHRLVWRTGITSNDFTEADIGSTITADNTYNTLDLSGILPAAAASLPICVKLRISHSAGCSSLVRTDSGNTANVGEVTNNSSMAAMTGHFWINCTSSRTIDYLISLTPTSWQLTVLGYFVPA